MKHGLGIGMHSYGMHWRAARTNAERARFHDALTFLTYAHQIGAAGVQVFIGACGSERAGKLRAATEEFDIYLEGQTSLPRGDSDVDRFTSEIRDAREAGATVIRTALLSGRRYETFKSAESFREFSKRSWESLTLAEPIVRKYGIRLAVENHKDWLISELIGMVERLSSSNVGVCLDFGNSIALLETPAEFVQAYAPWVVSTHVKDMAVQETNAGFLLSEVVLGTGFIRLQEIMDACRAANPKVRFNLEMITRDPLNVPCLRDDYWITLREMPARQLGRALAVIRDKSVASWRGAQASGLRSNEENVASGEVAQSGQPDAISKLPLISGMSDEAKLVREDENVRASLAYARQELNL